MSKPASGVTPRRNNPAKPRLGLLLRARVVVPVSRPPISDGAVLISGGRIGAVARWRDLRQEPHSATLDLGEAALLPGLVNAHCHLDYTGMAGQFPPPERFTDWLKLITSTKAGWSYADYAESWESGAKMLLRTGTTTVGDIEAVPELLPRVWENTPLRVISFLELIGITHRRTPQALLKAAVERILSLRSARFRLGLSPHAPYTTLPQLLRLCASTASRHRWRVAIHVAESAPEYDMFARGQGEMFDWLRGSGRDMSDCGLRSPVQQLENCGLLSESLLAVHANYLHRGDAALLGKRKVHVVHCPRSHFYFRHAPFPLPQLLKARVNVCLGTDSLATVYRARRQVVELNMFDEMRALARAHSWLSPKVIFEMATVNGARALGLPGEVGELLPSARADLVVVPFSGVTEQMYEPILQHQGQVLGSMIGGRWVIPPNVSRPAETPARRDS